MEITVGLFFILFAMAFICEYIDSALGMGYGTILAPVLIIIGFDPLVAVPAILLSQAFGGFTASIFHHRFRNVTFSTDSKDLHVVFIVTGFGIAATILAALISINIPRVALKTYIGVLVFVMGVIILRNRKFKFSWNKMIGIAVLSAFNKGLSGGGFGPVVTGGQILSGRGHKGAIGATTLAEAPICIVAFFTYLLGMAAKEISVPVLTMPVADLFTKMFSAKMIQWELLLALLAGSILVAPFGAFTTCRLNEKKMHLVLGILVTGLGAWTLLKTYL